ncbi:hypothetical protein KKG58_01025, partial [Patescibacteria group bacterium]|nr:hypothetical protein [Patescibacteria group bacterium]
IEKNFCEGAIKKCRENFSVLLAVAKRRRAETLGGSAARRAALKLRIRIFAKKSSDFVQDRQPNLCSPYHPIWRPVE